MLNLHLSAAPWMTMMIMTTTLPSPPPLAPSLQLPLPSSYLQQQQQTSIVTLPLLQSPPPSPPPPWLLMLLFPPTVFQQVNLDAFGKILVKIQTFLLHCLTEF